MKDWHERVVLVAEIAAKVSALCVVETYDPRHQNITGVIFSWNFPGGTFLGGIFLGGIYQAPYSRPRD